MTELSVLNGLSDVAANYDVLLCDVWGVIHNGRESFPKAVEALVEFRKTRGPVVLVSNAPRPSRDVVPQLHALKVPDEAWSAFVTSGDATRTELAKRRPGPAWALGPARDAPLYEGLGLEMVETPEDAAFISCTGLFDDEVETPEDFRERLQGCAARGLEMVCANPDRVVQRGSKMIYCAGALAELYEELGGKVVMAGKPYGPIYTLARDAAEKCAGRHIETGRILAVGDGIPTDVKGANAQCLDLLFIAAGIHAKDAQGPDGKLDGARAAEMLRQADAHARYALNELCW
jgi:HAD superfamily hydrolase (TIGR01459 family)